ncbi:hypothetical protein TRFO_31447 [Tritrichomonas foetus]|uniref:Uncharacterized protein n=1 Tax=Tritrichomonas foetus TaxID=1144522 RepID=A0A1J4JTA5_9EUKA|nr:hypothetical protein TRFO_31447 [Tritrichomonas foetus]|eukprot:OHT01664.1 hypothetical protein TRFO_31447 [Tritrichomonas foetus]
MCCLYSSGVRLHELRSIAEILCQIVTTMKPPNREMKRSFPQLIGWYRSNWTTVSPLLPLIQLRDENGQVIGCPVM